MARTEIDRAVRPSILDRLTDLEPRQTTDQVTSRDESARAFRIAVQREVEWLLNTRRTMVAVPAGYKEVMNSVHEYGIADTSGLAIGTTDAQQQLSDDIREALRRFEPRLSNVVVRLTASSQVLAPQVRFSIEATLLMDPSPERVVFDTVLELDSRTYGIADAV